MNGHVDDGVVFFMLHMVSKHRFDRKQELSWGPREWKSINADIFCINMILIMYSTWPHKQRDTRNIKTMVDKSLIDGSILTGTNVRYGK